MHSRGWALIKSNASPAGNRTPASRVTGGDTNHYTTEDLNLQFWQFPFYVKDTDTKVAHSSVTNKDCRKHPLNPIPVDIIKYSLQYTEYTPQTELVLIKSTAPPRWGIKPRPPAWQAGILTTILPRIWICNLGNFFFMSMTWIQK